MCYISDHRDSHILPWIRLGNTEDLYVNVKYFKIPPDILVFRHDSFAKLCLAESS